MKFNKEDDQVRVDLNNATCRKHDLKDMPYLSEYFEEYSANTSLHGIKYLGDRKRATVERLLWMVLLIFSLIFCSILIFRTYEKWQLNPVIVSFSNTPTGIWEIPFPAVSICPETKFLRSKYNFTELYHKNENSLLTEEEEEVYGKLSLLCKFTEYNDSLIETFQSDVHDFIVEAAPKIDDVFELCRWNNKVVNCTDIFKRTFNGEGVCYSFNVLNSNDIFKTEGNIYLNSSEIANTTNWSIEDGYKESVKYPRRVFAADPNVGLQLVLLSMEDDFDFLCQNSIYTIQGFKILLHQPGEIPKSSNEFYRVPINQEVTVAINPSMIQTTEGLKSYDWKTRKCFFEKERQLKYFMKYTQKNCEIECQTNITLKNCQCVEYHMPRKKTTPICGPAKRKCVGKIEEQVISSQTQYISDNPEEQCNCLPACKTLQYHKETTQANFEWRKLFKAYKEGYLLNTSAHISSTTIYFKESQFIAIERKELYGSTDFLANIGGIFGLFIGFSLLSLMEILYYFTLRPIINKIRYGTYFTTDKT